MNMCLDIALSELPLHLPGSNELTGNAALSSVQGGTVYIREWDSSEEHQRTQERAKQKGKNAKDIQKRFKSRLCWLHDNHPDGCPRLAPDCSFAHGTKELRNSNVGGSSQLEGGCERGESIGGSSQLEGGSEKEESLPSLSENR